MLRAQVQSLVGDLRFYKSSNLAKNINKNVLKKKDSGVALSFARQAII